MPFIRLSSNVQQHPHKSWARAIMPPGANENAAGPGMRELIMNGLGHGIGSVSVAAGRGKLPGTGSIL